MTALDEAIHTHPQLWRRMVELDAGEHLDGMVEALCIVGRFDRDEVYCRLEQDR